MMQITSEGLDVCDAIGMLFEQLRAKGLRQAGADGRVPSPVDSQ